MHDLLVIGGGPAGATCARRAAEKGLDVVLLEKATHPREKPCGGALSPRVIDLLDFDVSHLFEREYQAALVHTPTGRHTVFTREGLKGYLVQRSKFDEFLLKKASEAGAEVIEGVEVVAIEQLRKGIRALGVGESYKAHLLVGADGVNGITSKQLRIRDKWNPKDVALCIKAEVPMDSSIIEQVMSLDGEDNLTALDLYFGIVEIGYGWCFPLRKSLNIGIGCRVDKAKGLRCKWDQFISYIEKTKNCRLEVMGRTAARVPFGALMERHVARRSMLIGDAAGLVSSVSGEGISYAIESGILSADVAVDAVREKSPVLVKKYEQVLKHELLKELNDMRSLTRMLYKSNANIELICKIVDEDPVMREYLTDILARVKPYSNLWNQIRKRMMFRHPLKAFRLGFSRSSRMLAV
jgi:geranylgeranyl reductase family protein